MEKVLSKEKFAGFKVLVGLVGGPRAEPPDAGELSKIETPRPLKGYHAPTAGGPGAAAPLIVTYGLEPV